MACVDDAGQITLQKGHARALDRHVGARSHGDADIGGSRCRRVVHPVARHRDDLALRLQPLNHRGFLVGQDIGLDLVDPERARDSLGRGAVVARQHDDADALSVEPIQYRRRNIRMASESGATGNPADAFAVS